MFVLSISELSEVGMVSKITTEWNSLQSIHNNCRKASLLITIFKLKTRTFLYISIAATAAKNIADLKENVKQL